MKNQSTSRGIVGQLYKVVHGLRAVGWECWRCLCRKEGRREGGKERSEERRVEREGYAAQHRCMFDRGW